MSTPSNVAPTRDTSPAQPGPVALWSGRVISALSVLGLIFSAVTKFVQPAVMTKQFEDLGWPMKLAAPLGIVELTSTVLFVIPQTSFLGAILLTGYLGGAVATHVRLGENFAPPVIIGVMLWLGLLLRDPRLRSLLLLRTSPNPHARTP